MKLQPDITSQPKERANMDGWTITNCMTPEKAEAHLMAAGFKIDFGADFGIIGGTRESNGVKMSAIWGPLSSTYACEFNVQGAHSWTGGQMKSAVKRSPCLWIALVECQNQLAREIWHKGRVDP